jgi:hypothetical protein
MTVAMCLGDEDGLELKDEHGRVIGRVYHSTSVAPVGPGQGAVYLARTAAGSGAQTRPAACVLALSERPAAGAWERPG